MADAIFEQPRLAAVYDLLDTPGRPDLDPYVQMADAFDARTVIDVGCGTGTLACRLAGEGRTVIGVDPAAASLEVARQKEHAERVAWLQGTAQALPARRADLMTMTGNVAQVFLTDRQWASTLRACRRALRPGGRLVFECRDPSREAWREWTRERSHRLIDLPGIGAVETWFDLTTVKLPLVSFRTTFVFHSDGSVITSDSTLRFVSRPEVANFLSAANLALEAVRDAPDRPGREFVFVCRRREAARSGQGLGAQRPADGQVAPRLRGALEPIDETTAYPTAHDPDEAGPLRESRGAAQRGSGLGSARRAAWV